MSERHPATAEQKTEVSDVAGPSSARGPLVWSAAGQMGSRALHFVFGIVLARLVTPGDFGVVAIGSTVVDFTLLIAGLGLASAVVQRRELNPQHLAAAFWTTALAGALVGALVWALAPALAAFFGQPHLTPVLRVLTGAIAAGALGTIPGGLLRRHLSFRETSSAEILSVLFSGALATLLAARGFGLWSLLAQAVTGAWVQTALLFAWSKFRVSASFSRSALRELFPFSLGVLGTNVTAFATTNLDSILVGKMLGARPLGFYNRAQHLATSPPHTASVVVSRVVFSWLSRIQGDPSEVRSAYVQMVRVFAFAAMPFAVGLVASAPTLIPVLLGDPWRPCVPILQALAPVGLLQAFNTLNGVLYFSQGRSDLQFYVGLGRRALIVVGVVLGLRWGAFGVAVGYACALALNTYPGFVFGARLIDLRVRSVANAVLPFVLAALPMGAVMYILNGLIRAGLSGAFTLLAQMTAGLASYAAAIALTRAVTLAEISKWMGLPRSGAA